MYKHEFRDGIYFDMPNGIVPIVVLFEFLIDLADISSGKHEYLRKELYHETIELLQEEISNIYPEEISLKFDQMIAIFNDNDASDIEQMQEVWSEFKSTTLYYCESKDADCLEFELSKNTIETIKKLRKSLLISFRKK